MQFARDRPSRKAAPKNFKNPESDSDDDFIVTPQRSVSTTRATSVQVKTRVQDSSLDSSNKSTLTSPLANLNKSASLSKRASDDDEGGSPTKKPKVVLKLNKSTNASSVRSPAHPVTPTPSQIEVSPQQAMNEASDMQSLQSLHKGLISFQNSVKATLRVTEVGIELNEAKKTIALLEKRLHEAQSPNDTQAKLKQCEEKLANSLKKEERMRDDNVELTKKLKDSKAYTWELRTEIGKMMDEQDPNLNDAFKITDDEADHEWRGIAFDIRNFVFTVLTVQPYRLTAPPGASHKDVEALKQHQKKNKDLAPYHFQRYIWECLVAQVFQAGASTWGGPAGQPFHRFCLDISKVNFDDMEELSRVKAHTAELLSKSSDVDNANKIKEIAKSMKQTLTIFMDSNQVKDAGHRLWRIVCRAVELNTKFLKSRAFFLTDWLNYEFEWEDLDVQYKRGDPERDPEVEIEISPRLSKIGNADGRYFDSDKAMVICKPVVTTLYG
ncbi:hypothetical protein F53441_6831 [Fusarium austroafricanum]|uniref:Uncharacterized protein n=1 Tax=Fusarium austroafricanum TaxID=2364996 RepID=A0A8H4KIQ9_9HYPO|nr:hypothetical protein F53441_6831 [Fusarium austroafricanum]